MTDREKIKEINLSLYRVDIMLRGVFFIKISPTE